MGRKFLQILFPLLSAHLVLSAQTDFRSVFREFTDGARAAYNSFSDSVNTAFAESLGVEWQQYKVEEAVERSTVPEPVELPVASGDEPRTGRAISVAEEGTLQPAVRHIAADTARWTTSATATAGTRYVRFTYFDAEQVVSIPYDYGSFHPSGISETDVSQFWKRLSSYDYRVILSECVKLRTAYGYNDWALLLWVQALARAVFPDNINSEQTVFSIFVLNQLGLMTKIARADRQLIMLFASAQTIYSRKFIVVDTYPYYTVGESSPAVGIFTYNTAMAVESRPLDMRIGAPLLLGGLDSYRTYYRHSGFLGRQFALPINTSVTSFYSHYPQLDAVVYATAVPDERFAASMLDSIRQSLTGKTEIESVNLLLHFCQQQFDYKTDLEQFGYEKPFFPQENFVYEYNDCEDRSILFSYLVNALLGLPVVFLDYPGHLAAAVSLSKEISGDYVRLADRKYYVCDPTYIGASAGMLAPEHKNQPVKVWIIQ